MQTEIHALINTFCTLVIPQLVVIYLIRNGLKTLSFENEKKIEQKENTKDSSTSIHNVKPLDYNVSNGLVLIGLGIFLQMLILIYTKDVDKKDIDKKEEKDKITCEKTGLKDENSQTSAMSFIINNNTEQEQSSSTSNPSPKNNLPKITKNIDKDEKCTK